LPPLFTEYLQVCQGRVDSALTSWLPSPQEGVEQRLVEAMSYVVRAGGKRIRPVLVYTAAETLGLPAEQANAPACAVELMHAYSLVHDDLPAMDDDDLRRGQPTCHKAYDEATAILVGDALHTLAFQVLSQDDNSNANAEQPSRMIELLDTASGAKGMASGQAMDLAAENRQVDLEHLETIHRLKTGALISASIQLGALAAGCDDKKILAALNDYSNCIGLAFQVYDDILDVVGDTAVIGKPSGSDESRKKCTYPALLALEGAEKKTKKLHEQAIDALEPLGEKANRLRDLSSYIVSRNR